MDRSTVQEVFRYPVPEQEHLEALEKVIEITRELAFTILDNCPASADRSDALRKLREVLFTASQSIIHSGIV